MVFRFFEKIEKWSQKGTPKVMKIDKKSSSERPGVDCDSSSVDFGPSRKINDFWIALGTAKNQEKSVLGAPLARPADIDSGVLAPLGPRIEQNNDISE